MMEYSKKAWDKLLGNISEKFERETDPDLNHVLFLIGLRELGHNQHEFTKEQKQDLMHIAICHLLGQEGYFKFNGLDQDGWPHYEVVKDLPKMSLAKQEDLLKKHILRYFATQRIFEYQ